jgi:cytochrome c-type biogenesis protein CcmH
MKGKSGSEMRFFGAKVVFSSLMVVIVAASLVSSTVLAQATPPPQSTPYPSADDINAIARQLYCPVCENIPLDVCETKACIQWRSLIGEKLAAGWSEQQIKDYFVLNYGDRVLAEPPRYGLNWLVYILPVVFFVIGIFVLYRVLRQMRRAKTPVITQTTAPTPGTAREDTYLARVEEALRERKERK